MQGELFDAGSVEAALNGFDALEGVVDVVPAALPAGRFFRQQLVEFGLVAAFGRGHLGAVGFVAYVGGQSVERADLCGVEGEVVVPVLVAEEVPPLFVLL